MGILIIGSGPTGLILGAALARRGHDVVSVDRDPGPTATGWARRGVMQFEHAHGFRPQVADVLQSEWPEAFDAWQALGAEPAVLPDPAGTRRVIGMRSRRSTFERALRRAAAREAGLTLRTGHVDGLVEESGLVSGAVVDGSPVRADLVVDASGRSGRVARVPGTRHSPPLGGECGFAYVDRTYRLEPGAGPGPMTGPVAFIGDYDGYQVLVFLHEAGHFSVVIVRPTAEPGLKALRFEEAFDAACRAIPALAEWTHPDRSRPTSDVLAGGALRNVYRPQAGVPGLVAVGDSVATTTPTRGRGIAMACLQIRALLDLLDAGADPVTVGDPFGAWCDSDVRPWVVDHIAIDTGTVRRWQGEDLDLGRPLTSDLIADAAAADPRIAEHAGGYFAMTALPESLRPAEPMARAVYESGWRPPSSDGPTRDELAEVVEAALDHPADHERPVDGSVPDHLPPRVRLRPGGHRGIPVGAAQRDE